MARGGARKGAGRPKGSKDPQTMEKEKAREFVINKVAKELDPILTAQIEAAKGLYYEKQTSEGTLLIFKEKPDGNIGKYLLDQTIGKPKETVEIQDARQILLDD